MKITKKKSKTLTIFQELNQITSLQLRFKHDNVYKF